MTQENAKVPENAKVGNDEFFVSRKGETWKSGIP